MLSAATGNSAIMRQTADSLKILMSVNTYRKTSNVCPTASLHAKSKITTWKWQLLYIIIRWTPEVSYSWLNIGPGFAFQSLVMSQMMLIGSASRTHIFWTNKKKTHCVNWTGTFYSCCRFTDTRLLFVITRLRVFCHASCCEAEPTSSLPKLRKDKFIYTNKQSHKNRSSRRRSSKENKHQRRKMTKKTERRSGLHVCGRQLLHVQPALNMTQLLPAWSDAPERGETRRHRRRRQKHCANVIMIHLLRSDIWTTFCAKMM